MKKKMCKYEMSKKGCMSIILLLSVLLPTYCFAKSTKDSVEMVSYEQRWLDSEGTIALKNNTQEDIVNVTFQLTYLDMSGKQLDYEIYARDVSIAPGMTKKVDLPAYEHRRNYHYYKTKEALGNPTFKITYKLLSYNDVPEVEEQPEYEEELPVFGSGHQMLSAVLGFVAVLVVVVLVVGFYVLVAVMAKKRNRNVPVWVILSLFTTPFLVIIILWFIGNNKRGPFEG